MMVQVAHSARRHTAVYECVPESEVTVTVIVQVKGESAEVYMTSEEVRKVTPI